MMNQFKRERIILVSITTLLLSFIFISSFSFFYVSNGARKFLEKDMFFVENASKAEINVLLLRRYEKDIFLNVGDKKIYASYYQKWKTQSNLLDGTLILLKKGSINYNNSEYAEVFSTQIEKYNDYKSAMEIIYKKIQSGKLKTPQQCNKEMTKHKESIRFLSESSSEVSQTSAMKLSEEKKRLYRNLNIVLFSNSALFLFILTLVLFTAYISKKYFRKFIKYGEKLKNAKQKAEEATEAKSTFLAKMSHEIRTPMNGLYGYMDLLSETELDSQQKEYLETAKESFKILLNLINSILDLSKIEANKIILEHIDFNLHGLFENVASYMAYSAQMKGVNLNLFIEESVPEFACGDPTRIEQIANNLLSNAIKFTKKGEIKIILSADKLTDENFRLKANFSDTGIGISKENLAEIFESFVQADSSTTRNFGGSGLGLAISNKLANIMGGKIKVDSEKGKGSTFKLKIMLGKCKNTTDETSKINSKSCIIVMAKESDKTCIDFTEMYLKRLNIESKRISNPCDVIFYDEKDIDFIILDDNKENTQNDINSIRNNSEYANKTIILLMKIGEHSDLNQSNIKKLYKPVKFRQLKGLINNQDETDEKTQTSTLYKSEETKDFSNKKILLVEDSEINQNLILTILGREGFNCDCATNGEEAIDSCKLNKYDLILMDCQMPIMDGYQATKEIRKLEKEKNIHTPIIALTANAMSEDKEKCKAAGMDSFLSKPVRKKDLLDAIKQFINRKY